MAALRRLLAQLTHLRHASGAARVSLSVVGQTPPKVIEHTVRLTAIDMLDGQRYSMRGLLGEKLVRSLTRSKLIEEEAHRIEELSACDGVCEISVAGEWLEKLPPRSEEEEAMLKKSAIKGQDVDIHSRLACQIVLEKKLDGMAFAVPEPRPWRTN
ncbi:unnamed protein product [Calypogeia fissa]